MTTTALVPVFSGALAGQPTPLCNARDLHATLESGQEFANWIKNRIEQYGFAEGEDFLINVSKSRGRPRTDYHLSLDMAKELAMVENNERGRQVRRYFIQIEKEVRAGAGMAVPAFDARAAMLEGNSEPRAPLPSEVQSAINRKAWSMAHDAYELCREHLARHVAYTSEVGHPVRIDTRRALEAVDETTLDMALAARHYRRLADVLVTTEMVADMAARHLTAMRQELKGLTR